MKDEAQIHELIAKYLAGEADRREQEELLGWIRASEANQAFYDEMVQLWALTEKETISLPKEPDMDMAWAKIEGSLSENPPTSAKTVRLSKRFVWYRVAAVLLLLIAAAIWLFREDPKADSWLSVQTGPNEEKEVVLPDGSQVWLNEQTELTYLADFTERQVRLSGEAFFEVERMEESPFQIQSGDAITTVLGTSFNVRAYPEESQIEVTVETGKVALAAIDQPKQKLELPAGTSGVYSKTTTAVTLTQEKIANANAWKTEQLVFDDLKMHSVQQALERFYDLDIEVENPELLQCRFTGTFSQAPIEDILKALEFIFGVQVEKNGNTFILKGGSCK